MKILLVYPQYPLTFWNFKTILYLIGKKAAFPPLGLLTVASMLPKRWQKKLIDMNIETLNDEDLQEADMIFLSAMIIQKESTLQVIERAKKFGKPVVAGGALFTTGWEAFTHQIDHLVLGEAEETLPLFLKDLKKGKAKRIYQSPNFPDIRQTMIPDWQLIDIRKYVSMCLQVSRGCPFNCEFCDIVRLNGRVPRIKTKNQVIKELEALYHRGWRGGVFFVDDNFIGNKIKLQKEILPAIIEWQKKKRQPFLFNTQVSINLVDEPELMDLMIKAGFMTIFIGIESPNLESLKECNKFQNQNRDLVASVKKLQNAGFEVQGGFIVGFDSDTPAIFQRQIEFIQKSGIVTAMVGLLGALPKTRLYQRLKETGRLLKEPSGSNTLLELNFTPKMGQKKLLEGYQKIMKTVYSPQEYYQRVKTFLREFRPPLRKVPKFHFYYLKLLFSSFWLLGLRYNGRRHFWKLIFWSLFRRPKTFPQAIGFSITGIHFRRLHQNWK